MPGNGNALWISAATTSRPDERSQSASPAPGANQNSSASNGTTQSAPARPAIRLSRFIFAAWKYAGSVSRRTIEWELAGQLVQPLQGAVGRAVVSHQDPVDTLAHDVPQHRVDDVDLVLEHRDAPDRPAHAAMGREVGPNGGPRSAVLGPDLSVPPGVALGYESVAPAPHVADHSPSPIP